MGVIRSFYSWGTVRTKQPPAGGPAPGAAPGPEKFVYISKETLTFPGVTVVAGITATMAAKLLDVKDTPNLWISVGVGLFFGALLTWISFAMSTKADREASPAFIPTSIGVAVCNTVLLIASIHGIAEVTTDSDTSQQEQVPADVTTPSDPATTTTTG